MPRSTSTSTQFRLQAWHSLDRSQRHVDLYCDWVENFLSAPSDSLGRSGDVCPFTGRSTARSLFYVGEMEGDPPEDEQVVEVLVAARNEVARVQSGLPEKYRVLVTASVLFPDVQNGSWVDGLQMRLKDEFVTMGLMIGQFHPSCPEPGLHNENFRPLQSPVPALAIRTMVPGDFLFLKNSKVQVEAYLRHVPIEKVPSRLRTQLEVAINQHGITNAYADCQPA